MHEAFLTLKELDPECDQNDGRDPDEGSTLVNEMIDNQDPDQVDSSIDDDRELEILSSPQNLE